MTIEEIMVEDLESNISEENMYDIEDGCKYLNFSLYLSDIICNIYIHVILFSAIIIINFDPCIFTYLDLISTGNIIIILIVIILVFYLFKYVFLLQYVKYLNFGDNNKLCIYVLYILGILSILVLLSILSIYHFEITCEIIIDTFYLGIVASTCMFILILCILWKIILFSPDNGIILPKLYFFIMYIIFITSIYLTYLIFYVGNLNEYYEYNN